MSAVELRLSPNDLPREMGAMRVWLDQHRFEPSSFSCRDIDEGVLVSLEFKIANQAQAFAQRFGGRTDGAPITDAASQSPPVALDGGVSGTGAVG
jgi:hypothetical protein